MTRLVAGAATDVGLVRANNQDQLLLAAPLFAVADGMGGHAAGEVASARAVEALEAAFPPAPDSPESVAGAVRAANRAVWDEAQANPDFRGMGTTLTAIALVGADGRETLTVANVGDSRTYRLHEDHLEQLTVDHSLVAELVAEGQIAEDEAESHPQRHVLTRVLGVYPDVDVDVLTRPPEPGDRYLLCSDGLSREVTDPQIASVLRRLADPADAARELVAEAKQHGGSDNITVVVVDVQDGSAAPPATTAAPVAEPGPVASPARDDETSVVPIVEAGESAGPCAARARTCPVPPRSRRAARRASKVHARPKARLVTFRVALFVLILLAVIGAGIGGTAWYARSSYFVGLRGDRITIFQGRPGGTLWWKPTVASPTPYTTASVEAYHRPALRAGVQEASLSSARHFVANLRSEAADAGVGVTPTPPTTVKGKGS